MARPRRHDRKTLGPKLCERVATGELVKDVCKALGIAVFTPYKWASDDPTGFGQAYARAREDQAHAIAEQALSIADGADDDAKTRLEAMVDSVEHADDDDKDRLLSALAQAAIQRDKLRVDARKWLASKIAPKHYGDRQEIVGAGGGPISVKVTFSNE